MTRPKTPRNAPCPCGSGRKYKHCCHGKGFTWTRDEHGATGRDIPLSPEALVLLQEQRERFRQHFGRDPAPEDYLFFDAPPVEQVEHQMAQAMRRAGLDPAFIYAFEKTGRLVTADNQHLIPEKELQEWYAAVAEYRDRRPTPE